MYWGSIKLAFGCQKKDLQNCWPEWVWLFREGLKCTVVKERVALEISLISCFLIIIGKITDTRSWILSGVLMAVFSYPSVLNDAVRHVWCLSSGCLLSAAVIFLAASSSSLTSWGKCCHVPLGAPCLSTCCRQQLLSNMLETHSMSHWHALAFTLTHQHRLMHCCKSLLWCSLRRRNMFFLGVGGGVHLYWTLISTVEQKGNLYLLHSLHESVIKAGFFLDTNLSKMVPKLSVFENICNSF